MTRHLWAPWRLAYVSREQADDGCFLCRAARREAPDSEHLVVARGEHCFCIMNRFPYNNGHLMVAPYRHERDLAALGQEEMAEMMRTVVKARDVLIHTVKPEGFNVGWNLGQCAGAGLEDHLHAHIVPRWPGDTNFMPVLADIRVVPQALEELWGQLTAAWPEEDDGTC